MPPFVEFRLTGGLETKGAPDVIGDGQLQRARGCVYDTMGCVRSDPGRKRIRTLPTAPVMGEGDAVTGGVRQKFSKGGTTVYREGSAIGTWGAADRQISVVGYNGYAYITDGEVFKRYSASGGVEDVGLAAPDVTGLSITVNASGSFALSAGTYKWALTYYNGVAESNFSDPLSANTTAQDSATVPTPASWPDSATEVRVYRTIVGGDAFFRVGKVTTEGGSFTDTGGLVYYADPDATESDAIADEPRREDALRPPESRKQYKKDGTLKEEYEDALWQAGDVVQTNLGVLADWNDHDVPPDDLERIVLIGDRIYGISGNTLRFTNVTAPEHWSEYNSVPIGRQTGETLMAIMPFGSDAICYTDSGIWRFSAQGFDATQSQLVQTESQVGLAAKWAIADLEDGSHIFLGEKAIYLFDGRAAREISFAVEALFTTDHQDAIREKRFAVAASLRDKVWLSYGTDAGKGNNRTLFIDLQDPQQPKFSVLLYGFTTLRRNLSNELIGGDSTGKLYRLGTGEYAGAAEPSDSANTFDITTKSFPFSGSTVAESYDRLIVDVDTGGLPMNVSLRTNRKNGPLAVGASFTITTTGRQKVRRWIPAEVVGETAHVTFFSNVAKPRAVYAVGFGYEEEASEAQ